MAIGSRIQQRLNDLGWKRNDLLARVPNLTPQALSNLIRRDSVRSEWDEAIAAALDVSVLWLVYDGQYPTGGNVTPIGVREPPALPHPIDKIIAATQQLSIEGQMMALGYIDALQRTYPKAKANPAN